MAENHTSIESFQVYHYTQDAQSEITSKIVCFREGTLVGEIQFYRDGGAIPKSLAAGGKFLVRYSEVQFDGIIATFRNSMSINITFDSEKKELSISSGQQSIR
ncbi:MAG: hypothetical protein ACI837_001213 [Crocinitomicaceae bacterium]|jgi:hypothetical protein